MVDAADAADPQWQDVSYNCHGYRGVQSRRSNTSFRAEIGSNRSGTKQRGKWHRTAEEAAKEYDKMALEMYGSGAILNFPPADARKSLNYKDRDERLHDLSSIKCVRGHSLVENASFFRGRPICRVCNRLAAARMRTRKNSGDRREIRAT